MGANLRLGAYSNKYGKRTLLHYSNVYFAVSYSKFSTFVLYDKQCFDLSLNYNEQQGKAPLSVLQSD